MQLIKIDSHTWINPNQISYVCYYSEPKPEIEIRMIDKDYYVFYDNEAQEVLNTLKEFGVMA